MDASFGNLWILAYFSGEIEQKTTDFAAQSCGNHKKQLKTLHN